MFTRDLVIDLIWKYTQIKDLTKSDKDPDKNFPMLDRPK